MVGPTSHPGSHNIPVSDWTYCPICLDTTSNQYIPAVGWVGIDFLTTRVAQQGLIRWAAMIPMFFSQESDRYLQHRDRMAMIDLEMTRSPTGICRDPLYGIGSPAIIGSLHMPDHCLGFLNTLCQIYEVYFSIWLCDSTMPIARYRHERFQGLSWGSGRRPPWDPDHLASGFILWILGWMPAVRCYRFLFDWRMGISL